jgi:hypothetical protein
MTPADVLMIKAMLKFIAGCTFGQMNFPDSWVRAQVLAVLGLWVLAATDMLLFVLLTVGGWLGWDR